MKTGKHNSNTVMRVNISFSISMRLIFSSAHVFLFVLALITQLFALERPTSIALTVSASLCFWSVTNWADSRLNSGLKFLLFICAPVLIWDEHIASFRWPNSVNHFRFLWMNRHTPLSSDLQWSYSGSFIEKYMLHWQGNFPLTVLTIISWI